MQRALGILLLVFCSFLAIAQERSKLGGLLNPKGYVRSMQTISVNGNDLTVNNLIHNRINLKTYLSPSFTAALEFRNRFFYGETVSAIPNYGSLVNVDNGIIDLSTLIVDENEFVLHSTIDRLWLDYTKGKWAVRLGRQRINWGINLLWNSNDLFNAYNFVDFDYQERPGTDALRVQYFPTDLSAIDLAYRPGEDLDHSLIAAMWKFNKLKYDFQILAANYYTDLAMGGGFAGNIKKAGFKGEITYFQPKNIGQEALSASTSLDYSFQKGMYINASFLYNSTGLTEITAGAPTQFTMTNLSAKSLMPSKYSFFAQTSGAFNPALTGGMSVIYAPGLNVFFVMPSLAYSIKENWDIDLTAQLYFLDNQGTLVSGGGSIFFRIIRSF